VKKKYWEDMLYINAFPLIAIISSVLVIVVGVYRENKDAIIAGTTISGIAGTAYQSTKTSDENLSTPLPKKRGKPPGVGGDIEQ
jgi:hypothetical protein